MDKLDQALRQLILTLMLGGLIAPSGFGAASAANGSWSVNCGLWRNDAGFSSTIQLRNRLITKGIAIVPALFMADGTEYDLPVVYLSASGVATIDVKSALTNAPASLAGHISDFGSATLRYGATQSALMAQIATGSAALSESFSSQFASVASGEPSTQTLEGLWWAHDAGVGGFVALSNATDQSRSVVLTASNATGATQPGQSLLLAPRTTKMIDLLSLVGKRLLIGDAGGLRVQFDGLLGEVNVVGGLENRLLGYSAIIPFWRAPMTGMKMPSSMVTIAHPGIMIGKADPMMGFPTGTTFVPYLALRNLTNSAQDVQLTLYTAQGSALAAQTQTLEGSEARQIDVKTLLQQLGLNDLAGNLTLAISHTGRPDDLMSVAGSVDLRGTYVFEVGGQTSEEKVSKQCPYWSLKNGNNTMVSLWNPTDRAEDVVVTLKFGGGSGTYNFRAHIASRATTNIDIKELVANQTADLDGNSIPLSVQEGGLIVRNVNDLHGLLSINVNVGIFNVIKGTCYYGYVYCDGYWGNLILTPSSLAFAQDDDSEVVYAYGQYSDGSTPGVNASFSISDPSVASLSAGSVAPAGAGNASITATANLPVEGEYYGYDPFCNGLQPYQDFTGSANVTVSDIQPMITGLQPTAWQAGNTTTVTINGNAFGTNAPTLNFSDPGITYTLSSYSDTQIVANVGVDGNKPDGVVNVWVTSNGYNGQGFSGNGNGQSAQSATSSVGTYHYWNHQDITVVAWVDSNAITLPSYDNPQLAYDLSYPSQCAYDVFLWSLGDRVQLTSAADVAYANAYLLKNSGNAQPPPTIAPASLYTQKQSFRLFNDYGGTTSAGYDVGVTPDACGSGFIPNWVRVGQRSDYNGATGVSSSGQFYQLAEGRLGSIGQAVNQTLNGRSTPWIWSVIEFDSSGVSTFTDVSMFPSFSVYINGVLTWTHAQSSPDTFMANDSSYQRTPPQIN